jgi:hypothetical protein
MLKLSNDQEAVFAEEAERLYEERVVNFLRERFPDARALPRRDVAKVVHEQIGKAERYGMISERQVATYAMTAWILGVQFDETFPILRDALQDMYLDPERKAEILIKHTGALVSALTEA